MIDPIAHVRVLLSTKSPAKAIWVDRCHLANDFQALLANLTRFSYKKPSMVDLSSFLLLSDTGAAADAVKNSSPVQG
jgi:hypothetical protein